MRRLLPFLSKFLEEEEKCCLYNCVAISLAPNVNINKQDTVDWNMCI